MYPLRLCTKTTCTIMQQIQGDFFVSKPSHAKYVSEILAELEMYKVIVPSENW